MWVLKILQFQVNPEKISVLVYALMGLFLPRVVPMGRYITTYIGPHPARLAPIDLQVFLLSGHAKRKKKRIGL